MLFPQLKCLSGHDLYPCSPQGLHANFSWLSIITDWSDKGPNPKSGVVEQKKAVTGAFIAEQICKGPESFT